MIKLGQFTARQKTTETLFTVIDKCFRSIHSRNRPLALRGKHHRRIRGAKLDRADHDPPVLKEGLNWERTLGCTLNNGCWFWKLLSSEPKLDSGCSGSNVGTVAETFVDAEFD